MAPDRSVSVLIPAYNAAGTIVRALDSVAVQNYAPIEVIVVDDGSHDETAKIVANYDKLPIRLIRHGSNCGSSQALNSAIEAASHDIVAFLDADDEWLAGKINAQVSALLDDPETTLVATGYQWVYPDGIVGPEYGVTPFEHEGRDFWRVLLLRSAISKPTVLTRKSLIAELGGFDASLKVAEDQDMWMRLAALGRVHYVHHVLMRTYITPGSLMKRHRRPDLRYAIPAVRKNLALLGARLTPAERRAVLARRYAIAAQNMIDARDWSGAAYAGMRALFYGYRPRKSVWPLRKAGP